MDVQSRVHGLGSSGSGDTLGLAHVVLAEQELTVQVGHLNPVIVGAVQRTAATGKALEHETGEGKERTSARKLRERGLAAERTHSWVRTHHEREVLQELAAQSARPNQERGLSLEQAHKTPNKETATTAQTRQVAVGISS